MSAHRLVAATLLVMTLAACQGNAADRGTKKSSPKPTSVLATVAAPAMDASQNCPPAPPVPFTSFPDFKGGSDSGVSFYGLLFTAYPIPHDREAKIAWRMTGKGDLFLSATGPDGKLIRPVWGPKYHYGSNWNRPGDEWGSAFRFTEPGCWVVHARRGADKATAALLVG